MTHEGQESKRDSSASRSVLAVHAWSVITVKGTVMTALKWLGGITAALLVPVTIGVLSNPPDEASEPVPAPFTRVAKNRAAPGPARPSCDGDCRETLRSYLRFLQRKEKRREGVLGVGLLLAGKALPRQRQVAGR